MTANNGRHPPIASSQDGDEDVDMYGFLRSAVPYHSHSHSQFHLHMTQEQQQQQQRQQQQKQLKQQQQEQQQSSMDAFMPFDVFPVRATSSNSKGKSGTANKRAPSEAMTSKAQTPTPSLTDTASTSSSSATPIDLRKEQNRAAQRAFRDRKERYLQQLENMIQDLKEQHFLVLSGYQKKVLEISEKNEVLKSENHYLREVVFAFETALSKGAPVTTARSKAEAGTAMDSEEEERKGSCGCGYGYGNAILQSVKEELCRRHHANKAAESATTTLTTTDVIMSEATKSTSPEKREMEEDNKDSEPTAKIRRKHSTSSACSGNISSSSGPDEGQGEQSRGQELRTVSASNMTVGTRTNEILYRAPPLFIAPPQEEGGKPTLLNSPFDPLAIQQPAYMEPGGALPKITEYLKHPTVFDELQSSLFPPGTLQSLVDSNMSTPQEVIEDKSLFDSQQHGVSSQQRLRAQEEVHSAFNRISDHESPKDGGKMGYKDRSSYIPANHRLRKEFDILSSATPATDPKIDPMIYTIPHDLRIDIIRCPQLRAQMILHQDKYDVNEIFAIILNKAICHGPPLDPHSWELPDVIYTKFGYLFGQNSERHRLKVWPRKLDPPSPSSGSGSGSS